jgi:phage shock protein PspC (stress-responsive transcriptional regulator)
MATNPPPTQGYTPQAPAGSSGRALVRPREGKVVAGVLAGLARRFGISPTGLRFLFLLSMLLPGPQILLYIAGWILIPKEQ